MEGPDVAVNFFLALNARRMAKTKDDGLVWLSREFPIEAGVPVFYNLLGSCLLVLVTGQSQRRSDLA